MKLEKSLIKFFIFIIGFDFSCGAFAYFFDIGSFGFEFLNFKYIWIPVLLFLSGAYVGFIFFNGLNYRESKVEIISRGLGDLPIYATLILFIPFGFLMGNPVLSVLKGVPYHEIVADVQGLGLFFLFFSFIVKISNLRIIYILIFQNRISWKRVFVVSFCAVWVFGPRKAAFFQTLAPILLFFIFNNYIGKIKILVFSVVFLSLLPMIDIIRYGESFVIDQFITQIAGAMAPISAVASVTLNYVMNESCQPKMSAFWGNLYYFIPRLIWPEKPPILANSNYIVTTEVLGLSDNLSISGSFVSEILLITCGGNFLFNSMVFTIVGVFFGMISSFFIKFFFGIVGFWGIIVPLQFAMFREGIGLYLKDILVDVFMIYIFYIFYMVLKFAKSKRV